jgi:hypothetical protein
VALWPLLPSLGLWLCQRMHRLPVSPPGCPLLLREGSKKRESNESSPGQILSGPFTINIRLRNDSSYSARNPAVAVEVFGANFSAETPAIGEGWTIPSGNLKAFTKVQWDGGPVYSIHGDWERRLRFTVSHVRYYESVPQPKVVINLLAEGYSTPPAGPAAAGAAARASRSAR